MKKIICIMIIMMFVIPSIFAFGGKDRASGKITIYTSMYEEVIEIVKQDLQKKFPRCTIEFVYGGTGRIQYMIESERASGRLGCDILMVAEPAYSMELKESGLLHPFISPEAQYLNFDYCPEGYWYPVRINNMVLAYNPAIPQRNPIPNTFLDFANNANFRNAISLRNPNVSGTSMAALSALSDKYGMSYLDALRRQNVNIEYGSENALNKLESGEYRVIMILEETILQRRQAGSSLQVIYPTDGTVMIPSTIMIINNKWSANRNTRAAQAVTNWFLSEEGQNAIVSGWMHSVRKDFPKLPYGSRPTEEIRANSIPINWENSYQRREEILTRFEAR